MDTSRFDTFTRCERGFPSWLSDGRELLEDVVYGVSQGGPADVCDAERSANVPELETAAATASRASGAGSGTAHPAARGRLTCCVATPRCSRQRLRLDGALAPDTAWPGGAKAITVAVKVMLDRGVG